MKKIKEQVEQGDLGTWLKVHNFLPIVLTILAVVGTFYSLITKIEVLQTRVMYNEAISNEYRTRIESLESRYTDLLVDTKTGQVKGIATSSGQLKVASSSAQRK